MYLTDIILCISGGFTGGAKGALAPPADHGKKKIEWPICAL